MSLLFPAQNSCKIVRSLKIIFDVIWHLVRSWVVTKNSKQKKNNIEKVDGVLHAKPEW